MWANTILFKPLHWDETLIQIDPTKKVEKVLDIIREQWLWILSTMKISKTFFRELHLILKEFLNWANDKKSETLYWILHSIFPWYNEQFLKWIIDLLNDFDNFVSKDVEIRIIKLNKLIKLLPERQQVEFDKSFFWIFFPNIKQDLDKIAIIDNELERKDAIANLNKFLWFKTDENLLWFIWKWEFPIKAAPEKRWEMFMEAKSFEWRTLVFDWAFKEKTKMSYNRILELFINRWLIKSESDLKEISQTEHLNWLVNQEWADNHIDKFQFLFWNYEISNALDLNHRTISHILRNWVLKSLILVTDFLKKKLNSTKLNVKQLYDIHIGRLCTTEPKAFNKILEEFKISDLNELKPANENTLVKSKKNTQKTKVEQKKSWFSSMISNTLWILWLNSNQQKSDRSSIKQWNQDKTTRDLPSFISTIYPKWLEERSLNTRLAAVAFSNRWLNIKDLNNPSILWIFKVANPWNLWLFAEMANQSSMALKIEKSFLPSNNVSTDSIIRLQWALSKFESINKNPDNDVSTIIKATKALIENLKKTCKLSQIENQILKWLVSVIMNKIPKITDMNFIKVLMWLVEAIKNIEDQTKVFSYDWFKSLIDKQESCVSNNIRNEIVSSISPILKEVFKAKNNDKSLLITAFIKDIINTFDNIRLWVLDFKDTNFLKTFKTILSNADPIKLWICMTHFVKVNWNYFISQEDLLRIANEYWDFLFNDNIWHQECIVNLLYLWLPKNMALQKAKENKLSDIFSNENLSKSLIENILLNASNQILEKKAA